VDRVFALLLVAALTECPAPPAATYHVDCELGSDQADGLSPESAFRSLARASQTLLLPGDALLLRRGTTCQGALAPLGSGTSSQPISIGAYGQGPLPRIDASGQSAAFSLQDQDGFEIRNLELFGSGPYGLFVTASTGTVRHLRILDLVVHDVYAGEIASKNTGLVVVAPLDPDGRFEDVVIDGVSAWNTDQWAGIIFRGALWESDNEKSRDIVIRNSIVHDVYGDGIVIFGAQDALIESNVAYRTGLQPQETIGTPNGIWTWYCDRCTVQYNEAFETYSPGVDGGAFDIDFATHSNVVQYNYGHDTQAYCVSVFGALGVTTDAVVRYNVCARNGLLAPRYGAVYLTTWAGGSLDGVEIYNNTIHWDPPGEWPVLVDTAVHSAPGTTSFRNNLVYSTSRWWVNTTGDPALDHNLYWTPSALEGWFRVNDGYLSQVVAEYEGLSQWRAAMGQDLASVWADPLLVGDGSGSPDDFRLTEFSPAIDAGNPIVAGEVCDFWEGGVTDGAPDVGASEFAASVGAACGS